jgi:hypothetical protein
MIPKSYPLDLNQDTWRRGKDNWFQNERLKIFNDRLRLFQTFWTV